MKSVTIGSGSAGNCHYLEDSHGNILLIDLGLSVKEIKAGINFRVSNVIGAVATHDHNDHAKSVKDFEKMGIPVYKPFENEKPVRFRESIPFTPNFKVVAIPMTDNEGRFVHTNGDGSECACYGFLIEHEEMGKLLYITDVEFCKWKFSNVNHILLGIDYDDRKEYDTESARTIHTMTGHLSLSTGVEFVKVTSGHNNLQNVILCHLSDTNAEADIFITEVSKVANCPVVVAHKGMTVELRKE